jgi:hypothetical protein
VYDRHAFPVGVFDEHRQQVDLRNHNTWRMRLHEVTVRLSSPLLLRHSR